MEFCHSGSSRLLLAVVSLDLHLHIFPGWPFPDLYRDNSYSFSKTSLRHSERFRKLLYNTQLGYPPGSPQLPGDPPQGSPHHGPDSSWTTDSLGVQLSLCRQCPVWCLGWTGESDQWICVQCGNTRVAAANQGGNGINNYHRKHNSLFESDAAMMGVLPWPFDLNQLVIALMV